MSSLHYLTNLQRSRFKNKSQIQNFVLQLKKHRFIIIGGTSHWNVNKHVFYTHAVFKKNKKIEKLYVDNFLDLYFVEIQKFKIKRKTEQTQVNSSNIDYSEKNDKKIKNTKLIRIPYGERLKIKTVIVRHSIDCDENYRGYITVNTDIKGLEIPLEVRGFELKSQTKKFVNNLLNSRFLVIKSAPEPNGKGEISRFPVYASLKKNKEIERLYVNNYKDISFKKGRNLK